MIHVDTLMSRVDRMQHSYLETIAPIYYPVGFNQEILELIVDTLFEEDITVPFPPLMTSFREAFLERLVQTNIVSRTKSGYYRIESKRLQYSRMTGYYIPEYEYSSHVLRSSGREYRGFIAPSPWFYVENLVYNGERLLDNPLKAIATVPYILSKIVSEATMLGLNTVLFIDVDSRLAMYYDKPSPPKPWNWSLLRQLFQKTIACSDASLYGFLFCSKPHHMLLRVIASTDIDFIVIDPRMYSLEEINKLSSIDELTSKSIGLGIVDKAFQEKRDYSFIKLVVRKTSLDVRYLSFNCSTWSAMLETGWGGIHRFIKLLNRASKIL